MKIDLKLCCVLVTQMLPSFLLAKNVGRQRCFLDDDIVVVVICNRTRNVGTQVDAILRPIVDFEPITTLEMRGIQFPNGRIAPNWYNGQISIYSIIIELDNVTVIENNAFDMDAFRNLDTITLIFQTLTRIEANAFNNLACVDHLSLRSTDTGTFWNNPSISILTPIRRTLQYFYNMNFTGTFNSLFGGEKLSQLSGVIIQNPPDRHCTRILAPQNFSGLSFIARLALKNCGIEAILDQTFDYIGRTLVELNLSHNPLMQINLEVFWIFITFPPTQSDFVDEKLLIFVQNTYECDCSFYELKNMTMISFGTSAFPGAERKITCVEPSTSVDTKCGDKQLIHVDNWHLNHSTIKLYAFPRFQIEFNRLDGSVIVKQVQRRLYRLWIQNLNDPEIKRKLLCPNRGWLHDSINCLILSKTTEVIDIRHQIAQSELTLICVMYLVNFKAVWPLQCATIRRPFNNKNSNGTHSIMTFGTVGLLIGLFISCALVKYTSKKMSIEECQRPPESYDYGITIIASEEKRNSFYMSSDYNVGENAEEAGVYYDYSDIIHKI